MAKKKAAKKKGSKKKAKRARTRTASPPWQKDGDVYDNVRKGLEKSRTQTGGNFKKPPKGKTVIRLIPFRHDGKEEVFVRQDRHWNIDPANPNANVACLGEGCDICALEEDLPQKSWTPVKRRSEYLANAIVRRWPNSDVEPNSFIRLRLAVSAVDGDFRDNTSGLGDFLSRGSDDFVPNALDPKKGRDFTITRTGDNLGTRYRVEPAQKPSPIGMKVKPVDLYAVVAPADAGQVETVAATLKRAARRR